MYQNWGAVRGDAHVWRYNDPVMPWIGGYKDPENLRPSMLEGVDVPLYPQRWEDPDEIPAAARQEFSYPASPLAVPPCWFLTRHLLHMVFPLGVVSGLDGGAILIISK